MWKIVCFFFCALFGDATSRFINVFCRTAPNFSFTFHRILTFLRGFGWRDTACLRLALRALSLEARASSFEPQASSLEPRVSSLEPRAPSLKPKASSFELRAETCKNIQKHSAWGGWVNQVTLETFKNIQKHSPGLTQEHSKTFKNIQLGVGAQPRLH